MSSDDELKNLVVAVVVFVGIALGVWVFASSMEASAFNRATGKTVSTWDAMWVELRVQGD